MAIRDWNGNGRSDSFDQFMDMKLSSGTGSSGSSGSFKSGTGEKPTGIYIGRKLLYDASKDSDGIVILKSLAVIVLCGGGMALPVAAELGTAGTLLSIFGGLGLSLLVLKNV